MNSSEKFFEAMDEFGTCDRFEANGVKDALRKAIIWVELGDWAGETGTVRVTVKGWNTTEDFERGDDPSVIKFLDVEIGDESDDEE